MPLRHSIAATSSKRTLLRSSPLRRRQPTIVMAQDSTFRASFFFTNVLHPPSTPPLRRTKQYSATYASCIVVTTIIASHRPHSRRRNKTLSTVPDHRGCRRVVTSKQPAHQGHKIVDADNPAASSTCPSTLWEVNQHTLALAFHFMPIYHRLWLITTTGKPPAS